MKKISQTTHEIIITVNHISELKWQLDRAWKEFRTLQKELEHYNKFNKTIKLD